MLYFSRLSLCLILISLLSQTAHAISFENFPEFTSLSEDEPLVLEGSSQIDTKYSPVALTYQKPAHWQWLWLKAPIAFDLSIGSIDGHRFLIDDRARFKSKLNEAVEFRFTYFQEQNLETNNLGHELELIYWLNPKFGVSTYGELAFQKRKNDAGLAVFFKPEETHELKYFFSFVDFTRNDRNDLTDYFDRTGFPYTTGLVGRAWETEKSEFVEYALTYETPTWWVFPSFNYEYRYWKKLASVYVKKKYELRLQYDQKYESRYSLAAGTSTLPTGTVKTDRLLSYVRYPLPPLWNWSVMPGFAFNQRTWEADVGSTQLVEYIPHIIFDRDSWNFQYDLSVSQRATEHRLATAYQILFSEKSNLRIIATWDLTGISKNRPWGGGNAQYFLNF